MFVVYVLLKDGLVYTYLCCRFCILVQVEEEKMCCYLIKIIIYKCSAANNGLLFSTGDFGRTILLLSGENWK